MVCCSISFWRHVMCFTANCSTEVVASMASDACLLTIKFLHISDRLSYGLSKSLSLYFVELYDTWTYLIMS